MEPLSAMNAVIYARVSSERQDVEARLAKLYDVLETGELKVTDIAPRIKTLQQKKGSWKRLSPRRKRRCANEPLIWAPARRFGLTRAT